MSIFNSKPFQSNIAVLPKILIFRMFLSHFSTIPLFHCSFHNLSTVEIDPMNGGHPATSSYLTCCTTCHIRTQIGRSFYTASLLPIPRSVSSLDCTNGIIYLSSLTTDYKEQPGGFSYFVF